MQGGSNNTHPIVIFTAPVRPSLLIADTVLR